MSLKHFQFSSERQCCCSLAVHSPPIPSQLGASRKLLMIPENQRCFQQPGQSGGRCTHSLRSARLWRDPKAIALHLTVLRQPDHDLSGTVTAALWVPSTLLYIHRESCIPNGPFAGGTPHPDLCNPGGSSPAALAACDSLWC